ncbi:unnamed protein product, partial [Brenthis ino]
MIAERDRLARAGAATVFSLPRPRPGPHFFASGATQKRLLGQSEAPYTAPERNPAMQINSEEAVAGQRCPSLLFGSRGIAFMSLMEKLGGGYETIQTTVCFDLYHTAAGWKF